MEDLHPTWKYIEYDVIVPVTWPRMADHEKSMSPHFESLALKEENILENYPPMKSKIAPVQRITLIALYTTYIETSYFRQYHGQSINPIGVQAWN
jgi:hypothetical protein